jgi:hypothetical protein
MGARRLCTEEGTQVTQDKRRLAPQERRVRLLSLAIALIFLGGTGWVFVGWYRYTHPPVWYVPPSVTNTGTYYPGAPGKDGLPGDSGVIGPPGAPGSDYTPETVPTYPSPSYGFTRPPVPAWTYKPPTYRPPAYTYKPPKRY